MQVNEKRSKQTNYDYMVEGIKSSAAAVDGSRKPYHLQYAEQYRDNQILNPKLEGERNGNEVESGDIAIPTGDRRPEAGSRRTRGIRRDLIGAMLAGCNSICGPKAKAYRR